MPLQCVTDPGIGSAKSPVRGKHGQDGAVHADEPGEVHGEGPIREGNCPDYGGTYRVTMCTGWDGMVWCGNLANIEQMAIYCRSSIPSMPSTPST